MKTSMMLAALFLGAIMLTGTIAAVVTITSPTAEEETVTIKLTVEERDRVYELMEQVGFEVETTEIGMRDVLLFTYHDLNSRTQDDVIQIYKDYRIEYQTTDEYTTENLMFAQMFDLMVNDVLGSEVFCEELSVCDFVELP